MPKKANLSASIPIRIDPATATNVATIIASGIAADRCAALRAAAAALARGLVDDPRVWVVHIFRRDWQIFSSQASATAWLESQNARYDERANQWYTVDEDGDPFTWYTLEGIVPK